MDSHTEAQCPAGELHQASKHKNSGPVDSKPGNSGKMDFKRFSLYLEQVVVKGKNTDSLQYLMEKDHSTQLFAYYLLSVFGSATEALKSEGHSMTGNEEVVAFWAKFTSEGLAKEAAEEHLMMAFEHV